jgi:hypothetical protein
VAPEFVRGKGAHLGEVLRNALERPMSHARSFVPALPAELDEALARALSRERRLRPSLVELAAAPSARRTRRPRPPVAGVRRTRRPELALARLGR